MASLAMNIALSSATESRGYQAFGGELLVFPMVMAAVWIFMKYIVGIPVRHVITKINNERKKHLIRLSVIRIIENSLNRK
jgi:hypothetical protein